MSTDTVQILARWLVHGTERFAPRPEPAPAPPVANGGGSFAGWTAPPTPDWLGDETEEALERWRKEGLELMFAPSGIAYPDRLPFFLQHPEDRSPEPPLAELRVDHDGRGDFEAYGEIPAAAAASLRDLGYVDGAGFGRVSDRLDVRKARIVDLGAFRVVWVTESLLVELSASVNPARPSTMLMMGKPGARWVPKSTIARFARLDTPDRMTVSFPATIEAF